MVKIEWTETALKDPHQLMLQLLREFVRKLSWFSDNFSNIIPEPLTKEMKGLFKFRIGDWRVVYTIEDDIIVIQFVGHRSQIYKQIKNNSK